MPSPDLIPILLTAYCDHLQRRLTQLGVEADTVRDAVDRGRAWLERELTELVATPFPQQRRGVLELVQAAMAEPTEALQRLGIPPVDRDEAAAAALPGDLYGLAPASSQELGEDAWTVHMTWGLEKARAMARPAPVVVAWYGTNLMDRSKIEAAVRKQGFAFSAYRDPDAVEPGVSRVLVDLEAVGADQAISAASRGGSTVIAYGPHVDDAAMVRARSMGAAEAVPRSQFFRRLGEYLPVIG